MGEWKRLSSPIYEQELGVTIKKSALSTAKYLTIYFFLAVLAVASAYSDNDPTVYITKTGKKYHTATCSYLGESKTGIKLSEAVERGYTPCSRCNPPVLEKQDSGPALSSLQLYRVNVADLSTYKAADLSKMVPAVVVKHVDGDTVHVSIADPPPELQSAEKIRMLGVDTPETVHPTKEVEYFGKEASDFTKNRLLGKEVYLAFDWDLRDNYGRLLAYIYLPDGSCHNANLIREGYAHAYVQYPFQFLEEFRELEKEAMKMNRGLWK